jgi:hypothetical protein
MSFIPSECILPFGTQIHPVAKDVRPPRPQPKEYNATYLKTKSTTKVPSPDGDGPLWGTKPSWYNFNLPISKGINHPSPAPELYNANYLKSPSTLNVPAPVPLTLEYTHSLFSSDEGKQDTEGGPEQTRAMDPLTLSQTMAEATKGTANHDFWVRALQLLTKIKLISLKRPLTQVEKTELGNLIGLIQEKASDLRPDIVIPPAPIPVPLN